MPAPENRRSNDRLRKEYREFNYNWIRIFLFLLFLLALLFLWRRCSALSSKQLLHVVLLKLDVGGIAARGDVMLGAEE